MIDNESLPVSDDVQNQGPSEQELLDAVLKNTEFLKNEEVPLPVEEETVVDPAEADTEEVDPVESEEVVSEEENQSEEEVVEEEGEDAAEETTEAATQEPESYAADDLDLDAKLKVKVDGEEMEVSFGDLIKGYQTDAHLSKKGRELGEATKALEAERKTKLEEVNNIAQATGQILYGAEQAAAKEYHELEAKIEKARKDGDTFEMGELKDKREQVQKEYWTARKQREDMLNAVQKQQQDLMQEDWNKQIEHFQKEIPNLIPDFDENVAGKIRQFAIDEGINPDILNQITDPAIVKFVDDYRRLKQGVNKGTAKRKAIPTKKAIPAKKAPTAAKKAEDKAKMVKARAFKEDASKDDQMAFLRQYASKSLNL